MTRKPKRRPNHVVEDEPMSELVEHVNQIPTTSGAPPVATYLAQLRDEALAQQATVNAHTRDVHHEVERTIRDLEEWSNEIQATIAFLKATRR